MSENEFQQSLGDLITQIDSMPPDQRQRLSALADEARERHTKMKKTVADLQDSMDYLRLSIKYLLFDLEATRRENAYLRKLLEKQTNPGANADPTDEGETDPNGGE
ncbi:MAG: hypothetical protein QM783_00155 [Phycisphaerales bacterium]